MEEPLGSAEHPQGFGPGRVPNERDRYARDSQTRAVLNIFEETFAPLAKERHLHLGGCSADEVELSEVHAARFILSLVRTHASLRRRFPRALAAGAEGRFARWLRTRGARRL